MPKLEWAPDFTSYIDRDKYANAVWKPQDNSYSFDGAPATPAGWYNETPMQWNGFDGYTGGSSRIDDPAGMGSGLPLTGGLTEHQLLKQSGKFDLKDPGFQSYLKHRGNGDLAKGFVSLYGGDHTARNNNWQILHDDLVAQGIDPAMAEQVRQGHVEYYNSVKNANPISVKGIAGGLLDFVTQPELLKFASLAMGAYGGASLLGGAIGSAGAAGAGAMSEGAAWGAGLEAGSADLALMDAAVGGTEALAPSYFGGGISADSAATLGDIGTQKAYEAAAQFPTEFGYRGATGVTGAVRLGAGGPMMPAAVKESAAQLDAWGLTETGTTAGGGAVYERGAPHTAESAGFESMARSAMGDPLTQNLMMSSLSGPESAAATEQSFSALNAGLPNNTYRGLQAAAGPAFLSGVPSGVSPDQMNRPAPVTGTPSAPTAAPSFDGSGAIKMPTRRYTFNTGPESTQFTPRFGR